MDIKTPSYTYLDKTLFSEKVVQSRAMLDSCTGCAWRCGVNRSKGELGKCQTGVQAIVSSYGAHHGEERPISGWRGSGTIFFSRCNLKCVYCQNYDISQQANGKEIMPADLASIMIFLQEEGCHNINLVSPSHVVPQIIEAVFIAAENGLHLPLVYNTGGYDSMDSLKLLDGIVDIYMPDMKYSDRVIAKKYSGIPDYPEINRNAVREMHHQVSDLQMDENGIAVKGLLIRHLVLPNSLTGSKSILTFIANEISSNTYINIMDQYRPAYKAQKFEDLSRRITQAEYLDVLQIAMGTGLNRLDTKLPRYW